MRTCLSVLLGTVLTVFATLFFVLKTEVVRPVNILVIDEDTRLPIENIEVHYQLMTAGPGTFWGILPKVDPVKYEFEKCRSYNTDKNGVVKLGRKLYLVSLYQSSFKEVIMINLTRETSFNSADKPLYYLSSDQLVNPNQKYSGKKLVNTKPSRNQDSHNEFIESDSVKYYLDSETFGFGRKKVNLILKLKTTL